MTIGGLHKFIKDKSPNGLINTDLSLFNSRIIAVDVSILVHSISNQFPKKIIIDELYECNQYPNFVKHREMVIVQILSKINNILDSSVLPFIVFDGPPPPEKKLTIQERREREIEIKQRIETMRMDSNYSIDKSRNIDQYKKLWSSLNFTTPELFDDLKIIIECSGLPYIVAPCEAEKYCSFLCCNNIVAAVQSSDGDNLCYGCPFVIKSLDKSDKIELYILSNVLNDLGFTYEQFRDFCIMCGTDFNENIPRIAAISAYKLIKNNGSIDNIPNLDVTILNHRRGREIFSFEKELYDVECNTFFRQQTINEQIFNRYKVTNFMNNVLYKMNNVFPNFIKQN